MRLLCLFLLSLLCTSYLLALTKTASHCWNLRIILKCHRYTVLYQSFSIIIPVKTVNMQANMNVKITMYQVKLCHLLHSYLLLKRRKLWASSDVRRLCFIIIIIDVVSHPFALWKDTLLPFVNLKLIYFVFSKWENSILCCAFVSCLFIYNLNELFTFHGMVMPIFIIIYGFEINFRGNKRSFALRFFYTLRKK